LLQIDGVNEVGSAAALRRMRTTNARSDAQVELTNNDRNEHRNKQCFD
jgi:hypothetical protein